MNWASRWVRLVAGLIILLAITLGGAALYLRTNPVDLSGYRAGIAAELQAATGREIKITGKIILGVSLRPTLEVEGLEIANVKWGKAKKFVTVGQTKIRVHLFPLLQGRTEIISITADHAIVHLETDGDARRNWHVLAQAVTPEGEEADIPVIEVIKVSDIRIDYRDVRDAKVLYSLRFENATLTNDSVNGIGSYEITGSLDEHSFTAAGKVAPLFTISPAQPRQFDVKAEIFDMKLTADGSVKFPFKEFTYADFKLDAPKGLTQLAAYFGVDLPDLGAIEVAGNLTPFGDDLHFGNLLANSGKTDASGFVIVKPTQVPRITTELQSKVLDLEPYQEATKTLPAPPRPGKIFPEDSLLFELPQSVEIELRHRIDTLKAWDQEFSNVVLVAQMNKSELRATQLDLDMAGGRLFNRFSVIPGDKDIALVLNSQARAIDLATLFEKYEWPKYAKGKITMLFEGNSNGSSIAGLAAGLTGRVYFDIQQGTIPKRLSTLMGGSLKNLFVSVQNMFEGERSDSLVLCGFSGFEINQGVADNKAMLLITDNAIISGKGQIDLGTERLNLRLSPRPRDLSLLNLATDIDVKGTLVVPLIQVNKGAAARKVGKTALGVALGPLGLILGAASSVISRSNDRAGDDQCAHTRSTLIESLQAGGAWEELNQSAAGP